MAHILVVDDETHIRRLVQVNLERVGHTTVHAGDGVAALELIQRERFDLIVLDVMMPRMDGFEVLKRLKSELSTRDIPVIMLTAKAQDVDVFRGWTSGADLYLTKPFNPLELLSFVKRILDHRDNDDDGAYEL
jgi:two-component system alkaline phosphatase synthesis response regulator PhoP/two-component system response regulator VicR